MAKWLLVFKHSLANTVLRRSFLLTIFLLPLISYGVLLLVSLLQPFQESNAVSRVMVDAGISIMDASDDPPEGYIDRGRWLETLPPWIEPERLVRYEDEFDAMIDLWDGNLSAVYIIDPDYLHSGIIEVYRDGGFMAPSTGSTAVEEALNYNLLGKDANLTRRLEQPLKVTATYLTRDVPADPNNAQTYLLPYVITMIFFTVLIGASSLILNSIAAEKENRVMEILVTSVSPVQLITGKLVAQGIAGLLHSLVWLVGGFFLLRVSGRQFSLPANFELPPSIIVWGVLFFLLGYAVYGTLMAGMGVLVPGIREASQVTTLLLSPLLLPLFFIGFIVRSPNGVLATLFSVFPLTAPVAIMMRLSSGIIPLWHVLLSALVLALTAFLLVRLISSLFRARNLLSGQSFSLKTVLRALRHQV